MATATRNVSSRLFNLAPERHPGHACGTERKRRSELICQVVRWSALIFGVSYGLVHQGTLQAKYDDDKVCSRSCYFGT